MIVKGEWRIPIVFFEEGTFNPSGNIHVTCAPNYMGTADLIGHFQQFTPDLTDDDVAELTTLLYSQSAT